MKVSIIMPIYNEEKFIKESIESILNQNYKDFELIIIDDGSTDTTYDKLKIYLKDNRIQYYNIGKQGKVRAFNIGYSYSKGEYICFFHGDDIILDQGIELRLNPLMKSKEALVACAGKLRTKSDDKRFDSIIIPKGEKASLSGQSVMYKRKFSDMIFPIPEELPNEDIWMKLHIDYFSDKLISILEVLAEYRIHEENSFLSLSALKDFQEKNEKIHTRRKNVYNAFIKKYINDLNENNIQEMKNYLTAEEYRYGGKCVKILLSKLSIRNKLRFIFESNSFMYKIKNKFSGIFLGRG